MLGHYRGCMLGLAIGDALGGPTEFHSAAQIHQRWGPAGITDLEGYHSFPAGTFTDDTQMSLAVAQALLDAPGDGLDAVMAAMAARFVEWYDSPDNNRAPGNTCLAACARLKSGADWRHSGVARSKGCGAPMRAAPIGLRYHAQPDRLLEVARASSLITHGHPCALAGAAAVALAVSLALDKREPAEILDTLLECCAPLSDEFVRHLARVPRALEHEPDDAFRVLGDAWVAEEAVACALYCFLRTPGDYRATVLCGANANGDSDSIACIAGAISGAWLGEAAIP
ncbi:MAG: ADP-ribosylglycohydrolase family protein [Armatimonadetes bacterium]|nr:ADP-ribosylglycohydrolase family protein [Armatimonadota bacterium]